MFINKIGYEHTETGTNCQDFGFENEFVKCVVDGCSEGKHSEVGAKLFCNLFKKNFAIPKNSKEEMYFADHEIREVMDTLVELFPDYNDIKDHLLFTILYVYEKDFNFVVHVCGDGYIIKEKHDGTIEYEKIDSGSAPEYYAYNYIDPKYLKLYKNGVYFNDFLFDKKDYKSIGLASDGLRYILESPFKDEFEKLLKAKKEFAIRRLINRENNEYQKNGIRYGLEDFKGFKDDITIVF